MNASPHGSKNSSPGFEIQPTSPALVRRKTLHRRGLTDTGSVKTQIQKVAAITANRRLSFGTTKFNKRGLVASFFGGGEGDACEASSIGNLSGNQVVHSRPTSAGKFPWLNNKSSRFSEGSGEGGKEHIQVSVRVRPMVQQEISQEETVAWTWNDTSLTLTPSARSFIQKSSNLHQINSSQSVENNPTYKFDHLFKPESTNEEIFTSVVRSVVAAAMNGYHGSVFSYGQTNSGKTYTMSGNKQQPGIIPLAIRYCFDAVNMYPDREFLLRVSYLEVYNEQVNDLLGNVEPPAGHSPCGTKDIKIQHDPKLGTVVSGAREQVVNSAEQVIELMHFGESQRHVGATDMNEQSSRAHTLFKIIIESKDKSKAFKAQVSTLNLVDLAGSESAKMTNARGERAREGKFINQSLLTLSTIIQRLSEDNTKQFSLTSSNAMRRQHLPFRDSKLTRILESALDGNAHIAIICTVSPTLRCVEESLNTMKFAARAKLVRMNARINEVVDDKTLLKSYKQEIAELKKKLEDLESVQVAVSENAGCKSQEEEAKEEFMAEIIAEMERLILRADGSKSMKNKRSSLIRNRMSTIDTKLKDNIKYDFDDDENSLAAYSVLGDLSNSANSIIQSRRLSSLSSQANLLTDDKNCPVLLSSTRAGGQRRTSDIMPQEEDSVIFGVTKILSIMKDAAAKSKSKSLPMKSLSSRTSENNENVDLNKWGNSQNAVEQLISISNNGDPADSAGSIGAIAHAQYERLKLDLQLKDADNRFLQEELDQKDKVMTMLTEGLKEVEQIQAQWMATNQDLSADLARVLELNAALAKDISSMRSTIAEKNARIDLLEQSLKEKEVPKRKVHSVAIQTETLFAESLVSGTLPIRSPIPDNSHVDDKASRSTAMSVIAAIAPTKSSPDAVQLSAPYPLSTETTPTGTIPSVSVKALRKNFSSTAENKVQDGLHSRRQTVATFIEGKNSPIVSTQPKRSSPPSLPSSENSKRLNPHQSSQQREPLSVWVQGEDSPTQQVFNLAANNSSTSNIVAIKPSDILNKQSRRSFFRKPDDPDVVTSHRRPTESDHPIFESSRNAHPNVSHNSHPSPPAFSLKAPSIEDFTKTYPNKGDVDEFDSRSLSLSASRSFLLKKRFSSDDDGSRGSQLHLQRLSDALIGDNTHKKNLVARLLSNRSSSFGKQREVFKERPSLSIDPIAKRGVAAGIQPDSKDSKDSFLQCNADEFFDAPTYAPEASPVVARAISRSARKAEVSAKKPEALSLPKMKKGFMLKQAQTGIIKQWSQRYFVLDCGILSYYDSASAYMAVKDDASKGRKTAKRKDGIVLNGFDLIFKDGRSVVSLVKDKQIFHLDIRSDLERDEWVTALKEHIFFGSPQQQ